MATTSHCRLLELIFFLWICSTTSQPESHQSSTTLFCNDEVKNWRVIAESVNQSHLPALTESQHGVGAVMQITDPIGQYASNYLMLTAAWCRYRSIPLFVYGVCAVVCFYFH
jgi:hypothetical protein